MKISRGSLRKKSSVMLSVERLSFLSTLHSPLSIESVIIGASTSVDVRFISPEPAFLFRVVDIFGAI